MLPTLIWILEAAVVLVAVRQFSSIANKPGFRRETVWKPGWKLPLVGSAAIVASVGLWAAWRWPLFRHVGVAGLAAFVAAAWWRARPSYGRLRRIPPGSLGIGESLDALNNQRYYLEQAGRFGPVFKSPMRWVDCSSRSWRRALTGGWWPMARPRRAPTGIAATGVPARSIVWW